MAFAAAYGSDDSIVDSRVADWVHHDRGARSDGGDGTGVHTVWRLRATRLGLDPIAPTW